MENADNNTNSCSYRCRQQQHQRQHQHQQLAAPAPPSTTTVHHPPPPSTTSPPSNTSVCIHSFSRVVAVCHDHDHDDLPPPSIGLQHKAYEWLLFATAHYYLPPPSNASVCVHSFSRVVLNYF